MSNIRVINPKQKRHTKHARSLFKNAANLVEQIDGEVAGYMLLAWNDRGATSGHWQGGGIIAEEALPTHLYTQAIRLLMRNNDS